MKLFHCSILLTIFICVCCENISDDEVTEKYEEEDAREAKRFGDSIEEEKWHAVSNHKWNGADDWIPNDSYSPPTVVRIRKRKRRPQPVQIDESEEYPTTRRKIKPETLDEFSNSWGEMENESPGRPYHRRRVSPIYSPDTENDRLNSKPLSAILHVGTNPHERISESTKPIRVYEKVRDPFTALQEAEEKARLKKKAQENERKEEMTTVSDLKALLKQSGGSISLSEILQQKNLSLQDLLKGKGHAISALTEKPEDVVEIVEYKNPVEESTEPLPKWNGFYTKSYSSSSAFSSEEDDVSSEAPKKTFTYNKPGSIRANPSLKKYEVINEPTTERRIFVPSHPKYYTSLNYKPKINKTEDTTEKLQVTRTSLVFNPRKSNSDKYLDLRSKFVSLKPKLKNSLPVTSAKISFGSKLLQNGTSSTTPIPISAFTINLKDVFGIAQVADKTFKSTTRKTQEDGPMKMNIDIDTLVDRKPLNSNEVDSPFNTSINSSAAEKKNKPSSAREEIYEFLKDSKSRAHLTRILKLRNMTVEELVAQRERGSSQLHLADIFHNRTKEPEPPNEPLVGHVRNFFERKPKTISQLDDKKEGFKLKIHEDGKKKKEWRVTNFPTYKIESEKERDQDESQSSRSEVLIWKSLFPTPNPNKGASDGGSLDSEVKRVEEIENSISDAINNELNIESHEDGYDDEGFFKFPIGVKSAIIASAAIVGISCLVFFTIFVIFKWSQKQKRKLCYSDSFSCSRIKSPILETRPRRTIKTMMSDTLGRKRKYSNVYPQSMSDYMWENDKKTPFQ